MRCRETLDVHFAAAFVKQTQSAAAQLTIELETLGSIIAAVAPAVIAAHCNVSAREYEVFRFTPSGGHRTPVDESEMNPLRKMIRPSVCLLLLILLGGCSTPLPNSMVPNAASVWVGSTQGTGRWSAKPGDADIEITGVDSEKGVFPPYRYLDAGGELSAPLHLFPARHSIDLAMYAVFPVNMGPTHVSETVEIKGQGVIDGLFLENHAYRITARWINGSASGSGTFDATLWDVTESDSTPAAVQSWHFRGLEDSGPANYGSP